jgi:hypothetical protein
VALTVAAVAFVLGIDSTSSDSPGDPEVVTLMRRLDECLADPRLNAGARSRLETLGDVVGRFRFALLDGETLNCAEGLDAITYCRSLSNASGEVSDFEREIAGRLAAALESQ